MRSFCVFKNIEDKTLLPKNLKEEIYNVNRIVDINTFFQSFFYILCKTIVRFILRTAFRVLCWEVKEEDIFISFGREVRITIEKYSASTRDCN